MQGRAYRRDITNVFASRVRFPMILACLAGLSFAVFDPIFIASQSILSGSPAAVLYIDNPLVELGALSPGELREVVYSISNKGNSRLVINEVDRGCGCGDPVRRTLLIPPGATKDMVVSIDTPITTGAIEKLTTFTTNDPAQPRFNLLVRAWVAPTEHLDGPDADQRQSFSVLIPR
jgi:hypothetical protein